MAGLKKDFLTPAGACSKASMTASPYSTFIESAWGFLSGGALLQFPFDVRDRFVGRVERAVEWTLSGFRQLSVNDLALRGSVFVTG